MQKLEKLLSAYTPVDSTHFKGKNFLTGDILYRRKIKANIYIEIAEGEFLNKKVYGITTVDENKNAIEKYCWPAFSESEIFVFVKFIITDSTN